MIPQYKRTLDRCDDLIARAPTIATDDLLVSAICQHICVLMAGALETAVKEILTDKCRKKSAPQIAAYASGRIASFQNADPKKIHSLMAQFDSKWAEQIESFWSDEIKDHIGSIVGNRHNIAHGRPTEVSIARIREWRKSLGGFIAQLIVITDA